MVFILSDYLDGVPSVLKVAFAAGLVLAGVMSAQAADLIVDEAPAAIDTSLVNSSIYVQLLGGSMGSGDIHFFEDYGDPAYTATYNDDVAFAGTLGMVVMGGLSIEADAMYARRAQDGNTGYTVASTSLMGNLKYTLPVTDMFSVYGAVGVGVINYDMEAGFTYKANGWGYQLIAGAGAKLTDHITAIAEYRYQDTFDIAYFDDSPEALQAATSTVLVGIKLAF